MRQPGHAGVCPNSRLLISLERPVRSALSAKYRPLCASCDYVHINVGNPGNKPQTGFLPHMVVTTKVVTLSLPSRPNFLRAGLEGARRRVIQ